MQECNIICFNKALPFHSVLNLTFNQSVDNFSHWTNANIYLENQSAQYLQQNGSTTKKPDNWPTLKGIRPCRDYAYSRFENTTVSISQSAYHALSANDCEEEHTSVSPTINAHFERLDAIVVAKCAAFFANHHRFAAAGTVVQTVRLRHRVVSLRIRMRQHRTHRRSHSRKQLLILLLLQQLLRLHSDAARPSEIRTAVDATFLIGWRRAVWTTNAILHQQILPHLIFGQL